MNPVEDAVQGAAQGTVRGMFKAFSDWWHAGKCKKRLKKMLKDPRFEFGRTIQRLADGIGADQQTTRRWLVDIGARPSETNADLWTLKRPPSREH